METIKKTLNISFLKSAPVVIDAGKSDLEETKESCVATILNVGCEPFEPCYCLSTIRSSAIPFNNRQACVSNPICPVSDEFIPIHTPLWGISGPRSDASGVAGLERAKLCPASEPSAGVTPFVARWAGRVRQESGR